MLAPDQFAHDILFSDGRVLRIAFGSFGFDVVSALARETTAAASWSEASDRRPPPAG